MRWFTSDTHFAKTGDKILRREMRPYKTIKEYCDDQIRIWNEQASKDDVIYHLQLQWHRKRFPAGVNACARSQCKSHPHYGQQRGTRHAILF